MVNDPINASLIGLKEYSELKKSKPKKFFVQGNTDSGWRAGAITEWMECFVRVKNDAAEFIMPAANLCRLHKEDLDLKNPLSPLNMIS